MVSASGRPRKVLPRPVPGLRVTDCSGHAAGVGCGRQLIPAHLHHSSPSGNEKKKSQHKGTRNRSTFLLQRPSNSLYWQTLTLGFLPGGKCRQSTMPEQVPKRQFEGARQQIDTWAQASNQSLEQGLENLFCKEPNSKYFSFVNHAVSVKTAQF